MFGDVWIDDLGDRQSRRIASTFRRLRQEGAIGFVNVGGFTQPDLTAFGPP